MENLSRSELEKKIGGLEAQIDELQNAAFEGNEINLGEISKLQNELELLNEELDEMTRNDGDVEPKTKVKIKEYTIDDDKDDMEQNVREQEKNEQKEEEREQQEKEEQKEKTEKEMPENTEEVEEQKDGERRLTLLDWQKESGVELLPDDAIKKKYDKFLTREEFMAILDAENVPKIIREPGRAESFLKSDEDWRAVETSDSSLREAIESGNIPTNVDNDDYIKRQYGDGKADVRDNDKNPNQDGYGKIDKDDVNEALGREEEEQEEKKDKDKSDDSEERSAADEIVYETAKEMIDVALGNVTKSEVDKISSNLAHMMLNPEKALAEALEIDDDEYDIVPPKLKMP